MALFEEKKVEAGSYAQKKLEDLTPNKGDSVVFYLAETPMIEGDSGPFMVCNGLLLDGTAGTIDALVASAESVSFTPKTILQGEIQDGNWNIGQIARLESSNRPGDLNKKGIKTKYYAWNIYIQNAPNEALNKLKVKLSELQGNAPLVEAESTNKPKV